MKEKLFGAILGLTGVGALVYQADAGMWLLLAIACFNVIQALIAWRQGREKRAAMITSIILAILAASTAPFASPSTVMWLLLVIGAIDTGMIWRWRWTAV